MKAQNRRVAQLRNEIKNLKTSQNRPNPTMVKAPVAQNRSARNRNSRTETKRECERIASVAGSVAFASVGNYAINPGLATSFPWMSGVAQHYERYRIDSFKVRYKNLKGTGSDGNIIMSFDYDTLDSGPADAITQTQSTVYVDGAPWRVFQMNVPTDGSKKYIRSADIAGADLKTYDFGRVWISAEGCADTSTHGYIEFEYVVSLFEKQTATSNTVVNRTFSQWNLASDTASLSADALLDISEALTVATSSIPTMASGVITLAAAGYYKVQGELSFTVAANDSTSTVEIRVDGASQSPPVLINVSGYSAGTTAYSTALSCVVLSDGTTTVDLYYNDGTSAHVFLGDQCRFSVQAL